MQGYNLFSTLFVIFQLKNRPQHSHYSNANKNVGKSISNMKNCCEVVYYQGTKFFNLQKLKYVQIQLQDECLKMKK